MESYYGYIYRTDILDKGAYYIGKALCSSKGPFNYENPNYFGSGKKIKAYIKKYGTSNLKVSLLATANNSVDLVSLEKKFIGNLWKTDPSCWNLVPGGIDFRSGIKHSDESRLKMSVSKKGKPSPKGMLGKKLSEESKIKISQANSGKLGFWLGKSLPDEIKEKISNKLKGHPNYLKSHTEETKRKIGEASHNRVHKRGRHWFNNGKVEIQSFECPLGFVKGRLNRC